MRSRPRLKLPLAVIMRFIVLLVLVSALAGAERSSGGAHWWNSSWFWAFLGLLVVATATVAWRCRERDYRVRASVLEAAVNQRTTDLDRERRRELERTRILEMLVSNEPLGTVLDAVLHSIRWQCPDAGCAIVLKRADGCQVAAAVDVPQEWLTALRVPHALPFEVWREPLSNQHPARDAAWRVFASHLKAAAPGAVFSRPIVTLEAQPGALLLFYPEGKNPGAAGIPILDGGERLARLAIEQSRLYDGLHFQAHHDSLTGLPNRSAFEERLEHSLSQAELLGQRVAVLFVDLDRFKGVNDTLSHRVGDLLLCEVASRIRTTLRPADTVARIGGDEFTILVTDVAGAAEAAEIADRLLDAIRQPLVIDGHQVKARASIGVALFPDDGMDPEKLQRAADAAMYCAKERGGDRAEVFSARNEILDRARMDEELRVALREGYFVVHYQPKVGADRRLAGFEALIRMNHPALGQIAPMTFIPVAETNGLIVPIGAWVLDEVCRQIADWEARGLSPASVAVNVSPIQICLPDFAQSVQDCLERHGVEASRLELELTESLVISAAGAAQEQLRALRALGIRLSIDDFGTGYSSLSYLHRLPVDAIKLDKSFVQSIDSDLLAHRLVHAMIGVAQGLGLNVVAEGVETEGQRNALLDAGCSLMQGYLFARPQPAGELEEFLRSAAAAPVAANAHETGKDLLQLTDSMCLAHGIADASVLV